LLFSWLLILTSRKDNLAIRNLIESNIFNVLPVLGVTADIKEINIINAKIFTFDYM
jgi:Ca2+/Na+ antiporter